MKMMACISRLKKQCHSASHTHNPRSGYTKFNPQNVDTFQYLSLSVPWHSKMQRSVQREADAAQGSSARGHAFEDEQGVHDT